MMCKTILDGFEYSKSYDELHTFMQSYFPSYPIVANFKHHFQFQQKKHRTEAIENFRWIKYNHSWVNVLIFDIDYSITLKEAYTLTCDKIGLEPTWITETDKGVHIAYALTDMIQFDWTKTINLARHIKASVTIELNADEKGSHRLSGFWRNPLVHNFYASLKTYSLKDFYSVSNKYESNLKPQTLQQRFNNSVVKHQIKFNNTHFKEGNRNNTLWYTAMQNTNHTMESSEISSIVKTLHFHFTKHNKSLQLNDVELNAVIRSVIKYNTHNSNYVHQSSWRKKTTQNLGAMKLKPMRNLSKKDYEKEVKLRQKSAAQYTAKIKKLKTLNAIKNAIHRLKFLGINRTIRNIAAYSTRSIGTISRYIKEQDIQNLLTCSISFKHVIKSGGDVGIYEDGGKIDPNNKVSTCFIGNTVFRIIKNNSLEIILERIII